MNTIENNKIIAEFMEFKSTNKCVRSETGKYYDYHSHSKFSCIKEQEIQIESENGYGLVEQDFLFDEDLKFHSDWNWLMEVVDKIESLCFLVKIVKNIIIIEDKDNKNNYIAFQISVNKTKIEATNDACLDFIKWYNENK